MDTASEYEELRSGIAQTHNAERDNIEKQYIADKNALEQQYQEDIADNRRALAAAYVAAGLNSDGSDPQGRSVG